MDDILTVPVSKLDLRYSTFRTLYEASIQSMVKSMEKQGQLTPIVVTSDGVRFIVIDGFKRQRAAEILNLGLSRYNGTNFNPFIIKVIEDLFPAFQKCFCQS